MKKIRSLLALLLLALAAPLQAQIYPIEPIRLLVPFPAGGATDILARALSQKLGEKLGQPVVVENRPGAGGTIGAHAASKAAPDGCTLLLATSSTHSIGPASGRVGVLFDSRVTGLPHARDGRVRALAVTSLKPTALAPDLPTVAEVLPGFESTTWFGLYGPKGLAAELTAKVNQAVNAALAEADVKERFAQLGAEPTGGTPQAFASLVRADTAKWKKIITERGITID